MKRSKSTTTESAPRRTFPKFPWNRSFQDLLRNVEYSHMILMGIHDEVKHNEMRHYRY